MDQLNLLLATLAGLASAAIVAAVKRVEGKVDLAVVSKLGNLTPILVTLLAIALPKIATLAHLAAVPDAQALANAPFATIIGILAREALVRVEAPKPVVP